MVSKYLAKKTETSNKYVWLLQSNMQVVVVKCRGHFDTFSKADVILNLRLNILLY